MVLLGTKVFGFPACRQKSSESPASVSWPQPMPTRFTDFNEEWGKDIYIVKGFPADAREKEDLKGTSVSKLSWDDMANKVAKEIPLTKPTDLTYS
ncbi:hypothetical protein QFC19_001126 [Naganishia cerealis]|uniref:Uncharacterized protein n=1 Tax=Naganishia cerealis TaxID=610337 RepID=A0ACC2WIQ8_9TREE|nr:hypothetical protein QFC19_001126 [Naganishia cerealis]